MPEYDIEVEARLERGLPSALTEDSQATVERLQFIQTFSSEDVTGEPTHLYDQYDEPFYTLRFQSGDGTLAVTLSEEGREALVALLSELSPEDGDDPRHTEDDDE